MDKNTKKTMTPEEIQKRLTELDNLAMIARTSKIAQKKLINRLSRLIAREAHKIAKAGNNTFEDAYADGILGLLEAVKGYNLNNGPFIAWSLRSGIVPAIREGCRRNQDSVSYSRAIRPKYIKYNKLREEAASNDLTEEEFKAECLENGITEKHLREFVSIHKFGRLDAPISDDNQDGFEIPDLHNTEDEAMMFEKDAILKKLMKSLSKEKRGKKKVQVIVRFYGLFSFEPETDAQIAARFGGEWTRGKVTNLRQSALRDLKGLQESTRFREWMSG